MFENTEIVQMLKRVIAIDETAVFISVSDGEVLDFIAELNRDQLRKGRNSKGELLSDIGGGYSDLTLELNPEKSRFVVNLFDTGEYYDSINVTVDASGYNIESDPLKEDFGYTTNLFDRWGKDIEGLSEENLNRLVIEKLTEKYVKYLYENIF